jgi:hypothetical protein
MLKFYFKQQNIEEILSKNINLNKKKELTLFYILLNKNK